jgi:hypothetical protein
MAFWHSSISTATIRPALRLPTAGADLHLRKGDRRSRARCGGAAALRRRGAGRQCPRSQYRLVCGASARRSHPRPAAGAGVGTAVAAAERHASPESRWAGWLRRLRCAQPVGRRRLQARSGRSRYHDCHIFFVSSAAAIFASLRTCASIGWPPGREEAPGALFSGYIYRVRLRKRLVSGPRGAQRGVRVPRGVGVANGRGRMGRSRVKGRRVSSSWNAATPV